MNLRKHEVGRMVVDIPSGGVGGGHCDGPSRDRCRHWAACEGEPSRPELLCSRMLGMTFTLEFPHSSSSAQWSYPIGTDGATVVQTLCGISPIVLGVFWDDEPSWQCSAQVYVGTRS